MMARSCTRPARPANAPGTPANWAARCWARRRRRTASTATRTCRTSSASTRTRWWPRTCPAGWPPALPGTPTRTGSPTTCCTPANSTAPSTAGGWHTTGPPRQPPSDTHRPGPGPGSPDAAARPMQRSPVVRFPGPSQVVEFRRTTARRTLSVHGIVSHGTGAAVRPSAVRPRCAGRVRYAGSARATTERVGQSDRPDRPRQGRIGPRLQGGGLAGPEPATHHICTVGQGRSEYRGADQEETQPGQPGHERQGDPERAELGEVVGHPRGHPHRRRHRVPVSYTHLTLPTKRIV